MEPRVDDGDAVYGALRDLVRDHLGIYYDRPKRDVFLGRLDIRLREHGFTGFGEYLHFLTTHPRRVAEIDELASVLTNTETYFFRQAPQLQAFAGPVLEALAAHRDGSELRVWSAACASGEEPYSLAIALLESGRLSSPKNVRIEATDVSPRALERAESALYRESSLRDLDPAFRSAYFSREDDGFRLVPRVRGMVRLQRLNLVEPKAIGAFGSFDAIFCRNCLIYFEQATQKRVVDQFAAVLRPGGYLFLGQAESLFHLSDRFEPQFFPGAVVYRMKA